jgi:D-serine deaminase-like pyridoxal phosphate-dependent protein
MMLDTPALWVDLDALERNIAYLADYFRAAGVHWRPHVKGIKVPAIAHKALAAGATGVTCAKLGEAEVMAAAGIDDILVANQVVGPEKIGRLTNLRHHADVKVCVDDPGNIAELGRAATSSGVELGVLVEVDIGMARAGVLPGPRTVELAHLVHDTPGLRFLGLMGWEGQARAIDDLDLRRREIERSVGQLTASAAACRRDGLPVPIVSAGGSGTYYVTAFQAGITEIQAGGAIFSDVSCQNWGVETEPCLFVRATVTSRPAPDRMVVDAGFKALPPWKVAPKALGIDGVKALDFSAEHCVLTLEGNREAPSVGEAIDFLVGYGDVTVCLYDELVGLRRGAVEMVWPVLGRGKVR